MSVEKRIKDEIFVLNKLSNVQNLKVGFDSFSLNYNLQGSNVALNIPIDYRNRNKIIYTSNLKENFLSDFMTNFIWRENVYIKDFLQK